jgi:predicted metal-binding protein
MANQVDYIAILLACSYLCALGLGLNQIFRIFYSKNNKFSLRSGIIGFLTLSSFIRVVFWIKVMDLKQGNALSVVHVLFVMLRTGCRPDLCARADHDPPVFHPRLDAILCVRIHFFLYYPDIEVY